MAEKIIVYSTFYITSCSFFVLMFLVAVKRYLDKMEGRLLVFMRNVYRVLIEVAATGVVIWSRYGWSPIALVKGERIDCCTMYQNI